ncbi:DNA-directed RNA polymerase III subunit RPC4 [Eumeta japonica]|uniref:DNA-directed RNA polymerase III subunit RPC4 n=1 Tax=Eumeta variegata TaxID=151549 RepID=A0A4C1TC23_EUMVA|nr:DNA-directed RNA polymerase III subunit RPC4 [Eumeta japonica]
MADFEANSSTPNGTPPDKPALTRLPSFKSPRNLTLGGVKPNKKIFAPNLNVTRNKNKGQVVTDKQQKKIQENGRRDRKNEKNRNVKNGPNIIKGSGVFSEGMGALEKRSSHVSYGRDATSVPVLSKPTLKVKDVWKIDKELGERTTKNVVGEGENASDEEWAPDDGPAATDAPVRLPLAPSGPGRPPPPPPTVKREPLDDQLDTDAGGNAFVTEVKPATLKIEPYEDTDVAALLRSDRPTLLLLQLPDKLPGSGGGCTAGEAGSGRAGRVLLHRSGRVRLALGAAQFEVSAGTQPACHCEAVSVSAEPARRHAALQALGPLRHKLDVAPDWDALLADFKLT